MPARRIVHAGLSSESYRKRVVNMHDETQDLAQRQSGAGRSSLAERLDPALGEASAGIGVLMTELMRRTLRGGVSKIEEEIDGLVDEKVGLNVAQRMPQFEQTATETAQKHARVVATEAVEEVRKEHHESTERLTREIDDTRSQTEQSLQSTTEQLTSTISQSEARARDLVDNYVAELAKKSQKSYQSVNDKLGSLAAQATSIEEKLQNESDSRQSELDQLKSALAEARSRLSSELDERDRRLEQLLAFNQQLSERINELERPKGMKAMWNKVFRRKSDEAPPAIEFDGPGEPELLDPEEPRDD